MATGATSNDLINHRFTHRLDKAIGVLAKVGVATCDYKKVVANTFWAQIAVILMMGVWNDVT